MVFSYYSDGLSPIFALVDCNAVTINLPFLVNIANLFQVAQLLSEKTKLEEELDILKKLKISNNGNGGNGDGDMLNEIIKVSSEKEVLKRQLSEMTERVEVLEKATRQIELDNERLAFKVGQYHNQLLIPNNPHKNKSPNLFLTLVSSKQFNKIVFLNILTYFTIYLFQLYSSHSDLQQKVAQFK